MYYKYQVVSEEITRACVHKLNYSHQEADTKMICHAHFATNEHQFSNSCQTSDSDVFVLLLHFATTLGGHIWMDIESSSKNMQGFLNNTNLALI